MKSNIKNLQYIYPLLVEKKHSIHTRNSKKLVTPLFKGYGVHTVKFKGCSIWNSLNNEQREIPYLIAFRKAIKKYIIKNEYN